jgi:hypothetical protein
MGIGGGLWVVRYRTKASRPMKLNAAKRYAIEMIKGIRPGIIITDPIKHLTQLQIPKEVFPPPRYLVRAALCAEAAWAFGDD